eukprot:m.278972 g.278972  ORF g.278972 m.278972 type:complete len:425 (+) comp19794_c0_seq1:186-1460(+)
MALRRSHLVLIVIVFAATTLVLLSQMETINNPTSGGLMQGGSVGLQIENDELRQLVASAAKQLDATKAENDHLRESLQTLKGSLSRADRHRDSVADPGVLMDSQPRPWDFIFRKPVAPHQHRLGIIVPFRNVSEELKHFVPHMHTFLNAQGVDFEIFVVNQTDNWRFNRGQLINVGFLMAERSCDYIAMHDVDLLPLNPNLSYTYPRHTMHLASPKIHPLYHYPKFIGGVFIIKNEDFRLVNGLSNKFWGWGREDDDFYVRMQNWDITIERPEDYFNLTTGYDDTFMHLHDRDERPRDYMKVGQQRSVGKINDNETGVISAEQEVVRVTRRTIGDHYAYTSIEVNLTCNTTFTPWCKWYKECAEWYYRPTPEHRICVPCARRCWKGFVLYGTCNQTATTQCLKVGRDISPEEAEKWPPGMVDPS